MPNPTTASPHHTTSQEDAHISALDIDGNYTAVFSVFDGHGGKAVAKFAAKHMTTWLVKTEAFERGDMGTAVAECYYKLDELLDTEEGQAELKELAGKGKGAITATTTNTATRGLFADLEEKLEDKKPEGVGAGVEQKQQKPSMSKKLSRVDSSEEFKRSALFRHSVIPGVTATTIPNPNITESDSLHTVESGVESDFSGVEVGAAQRNNSGTVVDDDKGGVDAFLFGSSSSEGDNGEGEGEAHSATGMGCTAVSVVIQASKVTVANTGDSRCVLSRRGEATPLTLDHKPIIYEEAQRIIRAGGFVRDNRVNGALNVSRTIGDLDFKRNSDLPHTEQMVIATPDITELELRDGDEFLILACDGIWDVMSNQEAVDFVRKRIRQGQSLKEICEAMCDFCLAPDLKGLCRGADNMSVIVVLFKKHASLDSFWYKAWSGLSSALTFKKKTSSFHAGDH